MEADLRNDDMRDPSGFALQHAAAIGAHKLQLNYDTIEKNVDLKIEELRKQREEEIANENV